MKNQGLGIGSHFDKICEFIRGSKVLDIGCLSDKRSNELRRHKQFKKFASEIVGIDNNKRINEYRNSGWTNLENCDIADLSTSDFLLNKYGKFDHLVATDVIEHLDCHRDFLKNCYSLMKNDALFHISTPNPRGFPYINEYNINSDHTCWLDIITIKQLLARYDFKVHEYFFANRKKRHDQITNRVAKNLGIEASPEFYIKLYVIAHKN